MLNIDIVYHNPTMPKLEKIEVGNWIDLRASYGGVFKKGDFALIDLGVSMRLPKGYEAHVAPRSSTFSKWGIIETNGIGIIDNSFNGTNDAWKMPCYFTRDTVINPHERICQFRIVPCMPDVKFTECESLEDTDRGGFGSTGTT